jgi:hypothetical protein
VRSTHASRRMAARIDDVRPLMTSTMSMTRAVALLSTRRDAHDLLEYQTDILHFLSKVNLLMMNNLNCCRMQVILVFAFAY